MNDMKVVLGMICTEAAEMVEPKPPSMTEHYTAEELVRRAARYAKWKVGTIRWAAIQDVFETGSTTSIEICRACGLDPFEVKSRRKRGEP